MKFKAPSAVGAVLVAGALAFPVGAGAHIETSVSSVKAHTNRADAALDQAVALFERNRDGRARQSFNRSRREMGQATAEAARLRRSANSAPERAAAARAQVLIADQLDENVDQLTGLLDEVEGRVENAIARAARADTRGVAKAVSIIEGLLGEGVPSQAAAGLKAALAALSKNVGAGGGDPGAIPVVEDGRSGLSAEQDGTTTGEREASGGADTGRGATAASGAIPMPLVLSGVAFVALASGAVAMAIRRRLDR